MKNQQKGFIVPLLAVLVLILLIGGGLYLYKNKKTELPIISTDTEKVSTNQINETTDIPTSNKGIVVTSIKPNDLVKFPISIEGYLDGKGWSANEGEIGVVEVFDENGKSISNQEVIKTTTDWLKFPTYFKSTVGDRQMMSYIKASTGFVKITSNGAKNNEQMKSVSIPVRFK